MWTNYSSAELLRQYSPSVWNIRCSPEQVVDTFLTTVCQVTNKWRQSIPCELGISYGDSVNQIFDWFWPKLQSTRLMVYLHGGFWQAGSLDGGCELAGPVTSEGLVFVGMGYDLAPGVNLRTIVSQVRRGLRTVIKMARSRGIDEIYVSGHSAGAHLAALLLANQPVGDDNLSSEEMGFIRGCVLFSGIFDLEPVQHVSDISRPLNITPEDVVQLSPKQYPLPTDSRVLIVWGSRDSVEFRRQSRDYAETLRSQGITAAPIMFEIDNCDHFELIERFSEDNYILKKYLHDFLTY